MARPALDLEMDMTPMIDVTFQLLIFFMFTNALANPVPMDMPPALHGRGVTIEGQQLLLIDERGDYYLGDTASAENRAASLDVLVKEVEQNASAAERKLDVIVSAHKRARHGVVREVVERLGHLPGLGKIMVGVEEPRN